jgi:peptide/nickel transport system substrate-binding protein
MRTTWLIGAAAAAGLMAASLQPAAADDSHRGGTLRLLSQSAGGSLDPKINYTLQYWTVYQYVYDGLVTFKHAAGSEGFTIVPDLAEAMPEPQNGGKTYVFKIRKGIKFADGRDLTVKDVVASFQRIFKVSTPTAGSFYNGIVGADACLKTPATCTLDGGVVADEAANTVTINLVAPDAEFFDKLAVPHGVILPADTPAKDMGSVPIVGTGAYMFAAYDPNKQLKVVRNPYFKEWSKEAQPDGYPDEVHYDFGLTQEAQITAIENGQADWTLDQPPPDRLAEIGSKYKSQVHINTLTAMWYAPMNVNIPPFNNLKARQAVNFAIDRNSMVKLFGGKVLAQPACQVLPPGFPGYEAYCPYTKNPGTKWSAPDLAKAKQLVEESGTKGQKVTIIVQDLTVDRSIGTYLQSVLKSIGYDASVKALSQNIQFTYIQNTNNKVQISIAQWFPDYPAASDFLNVLLSCDSFHPGSDSSINIGGMCDRELDERMHEALKLALTDPDGANVEWAKIDRAYMEKAPWAPLFTPKRVDFVSKRLGNFTFSNQFYWLPALSWVK